jgi:hypothetical protein
MKQTVIVLFSLFFVHFIFGQRAYFDQETMTIGDQQYFNLVIPKSKGKVIEFPVFESNIIEGIEILDRSPVTETDDGKNLKQSFLITSFEDSLFIVPPFDFIVDGKRFSSNASKLSVEDFQADSSFIQKIDTSQQIPLVDIKGPISVPLTFKELIIRFWYIPIVIILAGLLFFLYRYIQKRRKRPEIGIEQPIEPAEAAHVIALRELDELKGSGLQNQADPNPFYIALSGIIRQYLETGFNIPAKESATFEIIDEFKKIGSPDRSIINILSDLLSLSDLVKFAKGQPDPERNNLMIDYAYSFVHQTLVSVVSENTSEEKIKEEGE